MSILPEGWRGRDFNQKFALWEIATMISGVLEAIIGVNMLGAWIWLPAPMVVLWLSVYFLCDGIWRIINAKSHGDTAGTLLLVFVDQLFHSSRQGAWKVAHPVVPDLTTLDDLREDWQLKIEAARAKKNWETEKIVRFGERYFRIESSMQTGGPRPFTYLLRALPAGVPGISVLTYTPEGNSQKSS
jgi:hypothetical protein